MQFTIVNACIVGNTSGWVLADTGLESSADFILMLAVPRHGLPMKGDELTRHLDMLTREFNEIAVPDHSRFVNKQQNL